MSVKNNPVVAVQKTKKSGFAGQRKAGSFSQRLLSSVLLCCSMPMSAYAEDLSAIYWKAVRQDPLFEAARYAFDAAMEKRPQARSALLPNVTANANDSTQKGDASFSNAPYLARDVRTRSWNLQLNQPLLRIGIGSRINKLMRRFVRQKRNSHKRNRT